MGRNYTPGTDDDWKVKLRKLLPKQSTVDTTKNVGSYRPLPSPMSLGEDGDDHINIWENGLTDLGKTLAYGACIPFTHSVLGRFSCINALWHYVKSTEHDDRIRDLSGKQLRAFIGRLTKRPQVLNFRAIIMDSNYQKIMQYPEIVEAIRQSTLPFECYYHYKRRDGVRIRPNLGYWSIDGFEAIRAAIKAKAEPDFRFLMDRKNIGIYDDVFERKTTTSVVERGQNQDDDLIIPE